MLEADLLHALRETSMMLASMIGRLEAKTDVLLAKVASAIARVEQPSVVRGLPSMTTKQHAALQMLLSGKSNQEIADRFNVSVNTAKVYVRGIAAHFRVNTRSQIVISAKDLFEATPKDWDKNYREPDQYKLLYAHEENHEDN